MRLVIVESPFSAQTPEVRFRNKFYARLCMRDCLMRGEAPFASHVLYTPRGVLDDSIPEERALGIEAGLQWGRHAEATVVYCDYGISEGMRLGIERSLEEGRPVEYRKLEGVGFLEE